MSWLVFALALLGLAGPVPAQDGISEAALVELERELTEAGQQASATRMRRAYKRAVRTARSLLEAAPAAPERWRVLETLFQCQKRLLVIEPSEEAREELVETCHLLTAAPDALAELRLEADLLLSERELSTANADVEERARALTALVARYRETPGEAKSLMMASQIAPKLEAFELEAEILRAMQERFADDHAVIEFRRKSLAAGRIEALFRGSFERTDGTILRFPVDRLGQQCLVVFWSRETPGFEVALRRIDAHRARDPERFDLYSLNVDELPDAGETTLRGLGLDWNALRLPGGRESQTFRTYGRREPVGILVNAYGYTLLTPTENYGNRHGKEVDPHAIDPVRLTDARYLAQLQSLFVGDFLMTSIAGSRPHGLSAPLEAIEECFPPAPLRYRLTRTEALANYRRAARLAAETLAERPGDPDRWRVRHARILALLGVWKLAGEPEFLRAAVQESNASLAEELPTGAELVPRFCLAKAALREGQQEPESILSGFVEATGGREAPAEALAAAALLAIDASSSELHQLYRERLLAAYPDEPSVWPVSTFLRDRFHRMDLLKVKLNRPERRIRARYGDHVGPRGHAINHLLEPMTERLPDIELEDLDGETLRLPDAAEGKLTLLLFIEPPAEPGADFPVVLDKNGQPTKNDPLRTVLRYAHERAALHVHGEVQVIAAFLCDDAERVRSLMEANEWSCQAAVVPGGLDHPLVRQLGILSADRIPNVFLLRRDGTVAWHISGFPYKSDFGYPFAMHLAMKVHIEVCDVERGYAALARDDFAEAKRVFSGPFELEKDERYRWRAPRFHGRALANGELGDGEAALADIEVAIEAHRREFDHVEELPCASMGRLLKARAGILASLGRVEEARADREAAATATPEDASTPYGAFHERLERLSQSWGSPGGER